MRAQTERKNTSTKTGTNSRTTDGMRKPPISIRLAGFAIGLPQSPTSRSSSCREGRIMKLRIVILISWLWMTGCVAINAPPMPKQGIIPAPSGGAAGYQHGVEGSRFVLGDHARRDFKYGYLKRI